MGRIVKADPRVWKIVEGKLYLNCREEIKRKWEQDLPGYIEKANKNWPSVLKLKGTAKKRGQVFILNRLRRWAISF